MDHSREFMRLVSDKSAKVLTTISSDLAYRRDVVRKAAIETAIGMYQESGDETDFLIVRAVYEPERHSWRWRERYGHLFETDDDFNSVYEECFVKACRGYADEDARRQSGIEVMGNGSFNNYFWGVLQNNFSNVMKSKSCESRNPGVRCPVCDQMVAPLNTHILRDHTEYADSIVADVIGKQRSKPWNCTLCPTYARRVKFTDREELRKHIVARHGSAVFERFSRDHPNHSMAIREAATSGGLVGREEALSSHDAIEQTASEEAAAGSPAIVETDYQRVELNHAVIAAGLTHCQMAMIDFVLEDKRASTLPTRNKLCTECVYGREGSCRNGGKLSREQYISEVNGLRTKMKDVLSGTGMG